MTNVAVEVAMKRILVRVVLLVLMVGVFMMPTTAIAGGPTYTGGHVYTYKWNLYPTGRTIVTDTAASPGWSVAFSKDDGPSILLGARRCLGYLDLYDTAGTLQDADPPYTYERVADNLSPGTYFCTAA